MQTNFVNEPSIHRVPGLSTQLKMMEGIGLALEGRTLVMKFQTTARFLSSHNTCAFKYKKNQN